MQIKTGEEGTIPQIEEAGGDQSAVFFDDVLS